MTTENIIALSSSIAGMLAAFAALATVLEMKKQRHSTYKPDFAIDAPSFYAYWRVKRADRPIIWSQRRLEPEDFTALNIRNDGYVNCFNIGTGSAKVVKVSWHFDVAAFVQAIVDVDVESQWKIEDNGVLVSINNERHFFNSMHIIRNQLEEKLPYLLPADLQSSESRLQIPEAYIDLYLAYIVSFSSVTSEKLNAEVKEPPSLQLLLQCKDVENNQHKRKFTIKPSLHIVRPQKDQDFSEAAHGSFEVIPG